MSERCPVTCHPMAEHHYDGRYSLARCLACDTASQPIAWLAEHPPADMRDRVLDQFRSEFHHAD